MQTPTTGPLLINVETYYVLGRTSRTQAKGRSEEGASGLTLYQGKALSLSGLMSQRESKTLSPRTPSTSMLAHDTVTMVMPSVTHQRGQVRMKSIHALTTHPCTHTFSCDTRHMVMSANQLGRPRRAQTYPCEMEKHT